MWDGATYCRVCLDEVAPELADLATGTDRFEETIVVDARAAGWRTFLMAWSAGTMVFGVLFTWGMGLQGLLFSQLLIGPIAVLFGVVAGVAVNSSNPRRVSLHEGVLTIRTGRTASRHVSLADCEWYVGDASAGTLSKQDHVERGERVLLVLPPGTDGREQEVRVALGESDESRRTWTAVLTLAGCPRRTAYERRRPFGITWTVLGVLAVIGTFVAAFLGSRPLRQLVQWLGGSPDLGMLIGGQAILPGSVYAVFYLVVVWPWGGHRRVRSSKSAAEIRWTQWKMIGIAVLVSTVKVGLPILLWQGMGWNDRIVAAGFALVTAILFGYAIGGRLAEWEFEKIDESEHADTGLGTEPR